MQEGTGGILITMTAPRNSQSVMQRDYKSPLLRIRQQPSRTHWLILLGSVVLLSSIFLLVTSNAKATRSETLTATIPDDETDVIDPVTRVTLPLIIPHNGSAAQTLPMVSGTSQNKINWQKATVKNGDSLAVIFSRMGLSAQELYRVMQAGKEATLLKHLVPGQEFDFHIKDRVLQLMVYQIDALKSLQVTRGTGGTFSAQTETRELEARLTNASGVIDSSLFLAGQKADLSDNLTMELAGIFGWDIDFVLDIRSGDHFTVVYEELFLDGHKQADGNIIAAEFVNRGKTYRAVRYTDAKQRSDYYAPNGSSMRKAFIRTPVDFTRISSRFGKRKHPISKTWKNHQGVDYVAPRGTPVKAAGDGKIVHRGNKGGYGKAVIIQHGGIYSTLYAHMSNYKRGLRHGSRVRQGQIIGYVGSTGRSTGPHLHYEFRVNGVHRNPLTVRLPDAAPIQAKFKTDFKDKSRGLISMLDALQRTTVALNDVPNNKRSEPQK